MSREPSRSREPSKPRALASEELAVLAALLSTTFPGRDALTEQMQSAAAALIDDNGSLRLYAAVGPLAAVDRRVPIEAEVEDADGVTVHILLHVLEGRMHELEIYREDSGSLLRPLDVGAMRLLKL
jgi:hypothetical protein